SIFPMTRFAVSRLETRWSYSTRLTAANSRNSRFFAATASTFAVSASSIWAMPVSRSERIASNFPITSSTSATPFFLPISNIVLLLVTETTRPLIGQRGEQVKSFLAVVDVLLTNGSKRLGAVADLGCGERPSLVVDHIVSGNTVKHLDG